DSKRDDWFDMLERAPQLGEYLTAESAGRFERTQEGLRALGIDFTIAPRLVRGFDYYTGTAFEFVSDALDAAQSTGAEAGATTGWSKRWAAHRRQESDSDSASSGCCSWPTKRGSRSRPMPRSTCSSSMRSATDVSQPSSSTSSATPASPPTVATEAARSR